MVVICSKSGTRENCANCGHNTPHEWHPLKGCECGACYPPLPDETGMMRQQNYPCVEHVLNDKVTLGEDEVEI